MNTPDHDTLFRTVVDARSILSEHVAFGSTIQLRHWSGYGRCSIDPS